jgi:hypothetical protein
MKFPFGDDKGSFRAAAALAMMRVRSVSSMRRVSTYRFMLALQVCLNRFLISHPPYQWWLAVPQPSEERAMSLGFIING